MAIAVSSTAHVIEDRWAMNYAASVFDENPRLYEPAGVVHVGYMAHLEWLVRQKFRQLPELQDASGIVQLTSDTQLARPFRWGERVVVGGAVTAVRPKANSAIVETVFEVYANDGQEWLATTRALSLYRGMTISSFGNQLRESDPRLTGEGPVSRIAVRIPLTASHVYSECARIWTPFHTDLRVSQASGYDRLILHGTATLSYCVSALVNLLASGDHGRILRFSSTFSSPVFVGTDATIQYSAAQVDDGTVVDFSLLDQQGNALLKAGQIVMSGKLASGATDARWAPSA